VTGPMLDQNEVCRLLAISRKTLQQLRRERKIKFVRLGYRSIRFRQEDVGEFIRRRTTRRP
jgi:excisionase family DNA binding protein